MPIWCGITPRRVLLYVFETFGDSDLSHASHLLRCGPLKNGYVSAGGEGGGMGDIANPSKLRSWEGGIMSGWSWAMVMS